MWSIFISKIEYSTNYIRHLIEQMLIKETPKTLHSTKWWQYGIRLLSTSDNNDSSSDSCSDMDVNNAEQLIYQYF